jgi:hypothetical protein
MAPPPPRAPAEAPRWKPLVLEEEEWAEALESIIERDFFPDIPKLQSKLEWLQARALPASPLCAGGPRVRVTAVFRPHLVILTHAAQTSDNCFTSVCFRVVTHMIICNGRFEGGCCWLAHLKAMLVMMHLLADGGNLWLPLLMQALRTRDPEVLRLAQQNIAARRAGLRTPIGATPGSFETPGASILRGPFGGGMTTYLATPASTPVLQRGPVDGQRDPLGSTHPSGFGGADGRGADGDDGAGGAVRQAPPMSLDRCALSCVRRERLGQPWAVRSASNVNTEENPAYDVALVDELQAG